MNQQMMLINAGKKVLLCFPTLPISLLASTEQEKRAPDVEPVISFVPLVITTLEFPYHSDTAHHLCARAAGCVPRQTPSCPAFFQQTGPSDIQVTQEGIWLHTKGNAPAVRAPLLD